MKIALAQIEPTKGNIASNIDSHVRWIEIAASEKVGLIVFPELSLTGYEPTLAIELAMEQNDNRLEPFQKLSDLHAITITMGLPLKSNKGIHISMLIYQPQAQRHTYSKQMLHLDEKPFFVEGSEQTIFSKEDLNIAPAICFESLQAEHAENASRLGANCYLASVAKSQFGITKAFDHYPKIATKHAMPVLMVNSIGYCDNFTSAGQSSVWNEQGTLIGQLDSKSQGLLIYDTTSKTVCQRSN